MTVGTRLSLLDTLNGFLMTGAVLSGIASALHLAIIYFGPGWYRFFGAGARMVRLAEAGDWRATAITTGIALVLACWALFALSGAGLISPLPLLKPALCAITAVYLLRGLVIVPMLLLGQETPSAFWLWSSAICLIYGAVHLVGLVQVWDRL